MMDMPKTAAGVMWVDCPYCEYEHEVLLGWDQTKMGTDEEFFGFYICDDEKYRTGRYTKTRIEESDGGE